MFVLKFKYNLMKCNHFISNHTLQKKRKKKQYLLQTMGKSILAQPTGQGSFRCLG